VAPPWFAAASRLALNREPVVFSGLHIKRAVDVGPRRRGVDGVVVASRRQTGQILTVRWNLEVA